MSKCRRRWRLRPASVLGDFTADAAAGAGDDGDLVFEIDQHLSPCGSVAGIAGESARGEADQLHSSRTSGRPGALEAHGRPATGADEDDHPAIEGAALGGAVGGVVAEVAVLDAEQFAALDLGRDHPLVAGHLAARVAQCAFDLDDAVGR